MKKFTCLFCILGSFIFANFIHAASGACSSHGGVDCSTVDLKDGSVVCFDGWGGSSVSYSDMQECKDWEAKRFFTNATEVYSISALNDYKSRLLNLLNGNQSTFQTAIEIQRSGISNSLDRAMRECPSSENIEACKELFLGEVASRMLATFSRREIYLKERSARLLDLMAVYYMDSANFLTVNAFTSNDISEYEKNDSADKSFFEMGKWVDEIYQKIGSIQKTSLFLDAAAVTTSSTYSVVKICPSGQHVDPSGTSCIPEDHYCLLTAGSGYAWDSLSQQCKASISQIQTDDSFLNLQISKLTLVDARLIERLKGRILLQVQEHGEAWYLDPVTKKRYYMKDGATAYQMLRSFGVGITNADLEKLQKGDRALVSNLKGRIILQVQAHGEAFYIHPVTGVARYLKDGAEAYRLMRELSLGIDNANLYQLPIGRIAVK